MTPEWFGAQTGIKIMLAPLATLAVLTILWLVNLVIADMFNQSGEKIIAALKGRSALAMAPAVRPVAVRVSQRSRVARAVHVLPQMRDPLRAAA